MSERYLKVIGPDGHACLGGEFDYNPYLPGDEPGAPLPHREAVLCESGWHWCTEEALMQHWAKAGMQVYVAEPSADVSAPDDSGKSVSSSGRLLRPYALPEWWQSAMQFIEAEMPAIPWGQQVAEPLPEWRVFTAPTLHQAWSAARSAARSAALSAAWSAAESAALMACMHVTSDLNIEQRHRDYTTARWAVLQRGWRLYGDVDGVLYVYGMEAGS